MNLNVNLNVGDFGYDNQQVTRFGEPQCEPQCEPRNGFCWLFLTSLILLLETNHLHLSKSFETMENFITLILQFIIASLLVICCSFCAELVHRSYHSLQGLSRENTKPFPWITDGWEIIRGLLNINIGAVLFMLFAWFAARVSDGVPTGSIWSEALITMWFVIVFASGFKISSHKRWKLF